MTALHEVDTIQRNVNIGSAQVYRAMFRDEDGKAIDPTVVTFKIKAPGGATTTYTYPADAQLVKDRVGAYRVVHKPTAEGAWYNEFTGSGADYNHVFTGVTVVRSDPLA